MRAQLTALIALVVIAIGADLALDEIGFDTAERQSTASVRLD